MEASGSGKLVGASDELRMIKEEIEIVARSDARVLITGESGVGKDVVARLIHERSGRPGPFVTINCAGVPDSLLESELFGHVRGSFTGAYRDRRGWLDRAKDGTMFLDEVGEMSPRMQALLLRFVENGEIQRVGSERVEHVGSVRVLAATNRNLLEQVAGRHFREDLYFRLNVIRIEVPPLRERTEDIAPLLAHFLDEFSRAYGVVRPRLSDDALAALREYSWPGNVRELCNVIERLVVRGRSEIISLRDVSSSLPTVGLGPQTGARPQRSNADVLYERMLQTGESFWTVVHSPFAAHDLTRNDLRELVARGLEQTRGNYKALLTLFNASALDYKRFLNFLTKHGCRLPCQEYRTVTALRASAPDAAAPPRTIAAKSC